MKSPASGALGSLQALASPTTGFLEHEQHNKKSFPPITQHCIPPICPDTLLGDANPIYTSVLEG